ncbi:hypothetical protein D9M69_599820 [compost metagenome]
MRGSSRFDPGNQLAGQVISTQQIGTQLQRQVMLIFLQQLARQKEPGVIDQGRNRPVKSQDKITKGLCFFLP